MTASPASSGAVAVVISTGVEVRMTIGMDVRVQGAGHLPRTGRVGRIVGSGSEARLQVSIYYPSRDRWAKAPTWYEASEVLGIGWGGDPG